ncbi:FAD:protein FMN transferase [Glaciecola sp. SC05]|uniref:FAD:protein FMN transferase n=1 Tax=Glaciecola sp. SC05 TaxID=1987355 RepID=UPI0035287EA8
MASQVRFNVSTLLVLSIVLLSGCVKQSAEIKAFSGNTMGTTYSIKFVQQKDAAQIDLLRLQSDVEQRLLEINQLMSTYISDSELSLLNKAPANQAFLLSGETLTVIHEALRLAELSDGALDITVGPLVNLWGFGPDQKPDVIPSAQKIEDTRAVVGLDKFTIDSNAVFKSHQSVYIDLSTIAKGYAVDQLALILSEQGYSNYLVEIGGEMRASGKKLNSEDWLLAIEKPITTERVVQRIISIGDNAIATSGDYRNYFEEDGVRFSHLIDPQTAHPIQHNLVAVSVVAPTCIEADGLATALIVLGPEKGKALAEQEGIAALFITKEGAEFEEYRSSAFNQQVTVVQ